MGWLAFHRNALDAKCAGLDAEQLAARSALPSPLSLLGLVRHLTEMERRRRIAWTPRNRGRHRRGTWRWELDPIDAARTRVTHTYDWTRPTDEKRLSRSAARATTPERLRASLDRLAALAGAPDST